MIFICALGVSVPADCAPVLQETVVDITPEKSIILGRGIMSISGTVAGDCLDFKSEESVHPSGQIVSYDSHLITSRRDLDSFLGISASMKAGGIAGFSMSGSASFTEHIIFNSYDVNYVITESVINQDFPVVGASIKLAILNSLPKVKDRPSWFSSRCGDSYVSKIVSGGKLVAALSFSTKRSSDASAVTAQLSGSYASFSASSDFAKAVSKIEENTELSISLNRVGGNGNPVPGDLTSLLKEAANFPLEVKGSEGAPLRASIQPYTSLASLPQSLDLELVSRAKSLDALVTTYEQVEDEIDRVGFITVHQDQFFLDPFDVPSLAQEVGTLRSTLGVLRANITSCVRNGTGCNDPIPGVPASQVYPGRR